jgi:dTDP-4-dehydrorhamnose 3,5-epimerase
VKIAGDGLEIPTIAFLHSRSVSMATKETATLPAGVMLTPLMTHPDHRGQLTEIFRNEWHHSPAPVQWVACRSRANVLRGMHVDARHWNYLCIVMGETVVGVHDLRPEEPKARQSAMIRLSGSQLQMLAIPPGIAHGFYAPDDAMIFLGSSGYDYDSSDRRRCRWDSAELALAWPCAAPDLSADDRKAGGYAELRAAFVTEMAK